MMPVNLYQSDVHLMPDAELETLSAELREAYCTNDEDGYDWWCDDAAENRYDAMRAEIRRRWELANRRGLRPLTPSILAKSVLETLQNGFKFNRHISNELDAEFTGKKIGQTMTVRKPYRFGV